LKKILLLALFLALVTSAYSQHGWYNLKSGTTVFLYDVHFINKQHGWAVGDKGVVLHTANSGKTWDEQESNTGNWLLSVHFIDFSKGWAVGDFGRIINTTDGGRSWKIQNSEGYKTSLNGVCFTDESYGWATGSSGLIRTTNGGNSWYSEESSTFTGNKGVYFVNPSVGWAYGTNGAILQSLDSGKTWKAQNTGSKSTINAVYFKNSSEGWILQKDEPKILKTTNGGNDWIAISNPVKGAFTGMSIVEDTLIWLAGQSGIAYSKNSGKKWKNQTPSQVPNVWALSFTDPLNGYAVGASGLIIKTTNGGKRFNVDFTGTPTIGVVPYSTTFTNLTTTEITAPLTYEWDFGDGLKRTIKNPIHSYSSSGTFTVTLSVSDGTFTDFEAKDNYIIVRKEFFADFTGNPLEGIGPLSVQFSDMSTAGVTSWTWDFGDGGYSTDKNPTHKYDKFGLFDVKLIVSNGKTIDSLRKVKYIKVIDPNSVSETILIDAKMYNYPNPFNSGTEIKFSINDTGRLKLIIYDINGRIIKELLDNNVSSGNYSLYWDGTNKNSELVPQGTYYYRLVIEDGTKLKSDTQEMQLIR
jgi:PKD repeat protein